MKERIISAVIMMMVAVPFLIIGNIPFTIFILCLGMFSMFEFLKFQKGVPILIKILNYVFTGILILKDLLAIKLELFLIVLLLIYLSLIVLINEDEYSYKECFFEISLILFLGIFFSSIIQIRNHELFLLLYLLIITVATDSFALFIGKSFGHHKLAPKISPNKTVEGFIGGIFLGTMFATLFYIFMVNKTSNIIFIILSTSFLSLIGSLGDLIMSSVKRYEKVKDFSNLIPGHGGIMDRLDSIIFVTLTYILISNLF